MVTIITEKLRNQSLDDVKVETVPVLQTAGSNTWAFTTSPSSAFQLTGNLSGGKGWTMFVDPKDRWPGQPTPGTTAKTTTLAAGPPLTGGAASRGQVSGHAPHPQTPIQLPSCPSDAKFAESCAEFEAFPSTPPAPPLKRHCRSLSIPSDRHHSNNSTKDGGTSKTTKSATSATTKWQPHAGQIWRPVASRPHSNKLGKSRGSPLSSSLHRPLAASRSSPHSHTPVAAQGAGVGGGAYATKGIWPLSKSEDFSTPPDSPVPRPASASSGFCDSLVNSSWLEKTVVAPTSTLTNNFPLLGNNNNNNYLDSDLKLEAFRLRSLSMEEPISRLAATASGGVGRGGTCSMPAIPGSNKTNHSTPSSPRRHRVQRCRSQPCVLHDRKCLKRRRDEERPALDFLKMTETAYDYGGWKNSGRCPQNIRWTRSLASLFTDAPHCVHGLNTIASSPLDSSAVPAGLNHPATGSTDSQSPCEEVVARRHTEGCRGHQQRRPTSDSGRRATGKGHDIATFIDSEDGCDCNDADDCKQADGEMFEMEMNNDIDIDQIEKD